MTLILATLALASTLPSAPVLRTVAPGIHGELVTTTYAKASDALLQDLFPYSYWEDQNIDCDGNDCKPTGNPALYGDLCYVGDIGKVCSTLSSLSKADLANYQDGAHEWAHLDGCFIQGRGHKPVIAKVTVIDDYSDAAIQVTAKIERCAE